MEKAVKKKIKFFKFTESMTSAEKLFCLAVFVATAIIIAIPFCNKAQIFGHDAWYHIARIEALKQQIIDGHPFSRINYFFYQGLGYASSLCYPDLLLYIPAFFRLIGLDINVSYNLFLCLCGIACFFTTFYAADKITKNPLAATICACLFSLSQYHLDNLYTRGSVGEIQAFIFIPLVIYGLYDFLYEDFSHPAVMAVGFIGLVLSHTISTFLCVLIYALVLIFNFKKTFSSKKKIIKLCITCAAVLLLTAFYWIPLIELMTRMDLRVSHPTRKVGDSAIEINYLFSDVKMADGMMGIGLALILPLALRIAISKKDYKADRKLSSLLSAGDMFAAFGLGAALFATKLIPWSAFNKTVMNNIQFSWRLFIAASILLSFAACIYIMLTVKRDRKTSVRVYSIAACVICLFGVLHIKTIDPSYRYRSPQYFSENYDDGYDGTCRTGAAEWLPYFTLQNKNIALNQCDIVKDNLGNTYEYSKDGTTVLVRLDGKNKTSKLQVPLIYYIGYAAEFEYDDGTTAKLEVSGSKDCGLCEAVIPENASGTLKVFYKGTALQKISFIITLLTSVSLIAYFILKKRKTKSSK